MLTKKEKLLIRPFMVQKYESHRRKVQSAQPAIDFIRPQHQPQVLIKLKKLQRERERMEEIEKENQRLLQKLGQIMNTNRLENYWRAPRPNFLSRVFINTPRNVRAKSAPPPVERNPIQTIEHRNKLIMNTTKTRSSARCPACSGKPIKQELTIPEERVPWTPPRRTWNYKLLNDTTKVHKCCKFCC